MSVTVYLHLLILCGILSQGIIGKFAEKKIKESSDFRIRHKRVVSYEQGGARVVRIEEQPYIVHIKKSGRVYCMGSILSQRVVITSAECVEFPASEYKVVAHTGTTAHVGALHNVTNINVRKGNIHERFWDGIALLTVNPAMEYGAFVEKIELHEGAIIPGMLGTVSGWGYNYRSQSNDPGTNYPRNLRSIQVPVIIHQDCVDRYRNYYPITSKDICTFHPQRHCGHTDRGAPLVIRNSLVGIFLRSGPAGSHFNCAYPEVYAFLQHADYNDWIRANI